MVDWGGASTADGVVSAGGVVFAETCDFLLVEGGGVSTGDETCVVGVEVDPAALVTGAVLDAAVELETTD